MREEVRNGLALYSGQRPNKVMPVENLESDNLRETPYDFNLL